MAILDDANLELDFDVNDNGQFARCEKALREINRSIPRESWQKINQHTRAAMKEASAKVMQQPALKGKHTGLRRRVARGIGLERFRDGEWQHWVVTTSMPEEDEAIIPRGLDTRRGWRHPIFGKRDEPWVAQYGKFSWFADSMDEIGKEVTPAIENILEEAANTVDNASRG